ncbi:MAG: SPFH domain-containing protein [Paludibacteraceae bacterium]|nr:SPFH domain-containing protein [Paludibacteraceae bacterium]
MGFFNKQRTDGQTYDGQGAERVGIIDNVFYNLEEDVLLARHPYDNLSTNARVTVQEGQVMVFCQEGEYSDIFLPGSHVLTTNNVPFLQRIMNLATGGSSAFKATLFVVSTTRKRVAGEQGWGIGMTVCDYSLGDEGTNIRVGAYGSYEFRITDALAFIRQYSGTLHEVRLEEFTDKFTAQVAQRVKPLISQQFSRRHIPVTSVQEYLLEIAEAVTAELNTYFTRYGIEFTEFAIEAIEPDEDDENYKSILAAKTAGGAMDFESRARARQRQREGYTYQQERQFDIMQGAAQNEGSAGQMMGAGMGVGMGFGMGGMFGQQMGQMAQGAMNAQPVYGQQTGAVPPPPPAAVAFHVLVNNAQQGPFELAVLQQMAAQGTLTPQTYVWKPGMAQWQAAGQCPELAPLFGAVPPPPPVG